MGNAGYITPGKIQRIKRNARGLRGQPQKKQSKRKVYPLAITSFLLYPRVLIMPHEKIAQISGVHHIHATKGSHFEHDGHKTAGIVDESAGGPKVEKKVEKMFGEKI